MTLQSLLTIIFMLSTSRKGKSSTQYIYIYIYVCLATRSSPGPPVRLLGHLSQHYNKYIRVFTFFLVYLFAQTVAIVHMKINKCRHTHTHTHTHTNLTQVPTSLTLIPHLVHVIVVTLALAVAFIPSLPLRSPWTTLSLLLLAVALVPMPRS